MRLQQQNARVQFVEMLETRRLFSVSPAVSTIAPAETIKPAIFGPSALEHTYKGITTGSDGVSYEIKLVMTPTSARLTVEGLGTYTSSLSSAQFIAMRKGKFSVKFVGVKGALGSITCTGKVIDSGVRIVGDYTNSADRSGTFSLKS